MRAVSNKKINQRLGKLRDPFDPESLLGFCIRHMSFTFSMVVVLFGRDKGRELRYAGLIFLGGVEWAVLPVPRSLTDAKGLCFIIGIREH
jgi:hypothetical protein